MWGMRDHATTRDYGHRVLGEREAIPAMLELFEKSGIHATWATVGFLICDGRDELLARAPEDLPTYADARLSNYRYMDEVGVSERVDPYYSIGLAHIRTTVNNAHTVCCMMLQTQQTSNK